MLRSWLPRSKSTSSLEQSAKERRTTIQAAIVVFGVGVASLCMWQNSQTPFQTAANDDFIAQGDEQAIAPEHGAEFKVPPAMIKTIPAPPPLETVPAPVLDQLVVHVDKHGNIDVAGEQINPDVFRNLLNSVKEDSPGDVAVLIHANEKCEVSTIQKVVDVCEECLTSYRLRIEDGRSQTKPTKPIDPATRA